MRKSSHQFLERPAILLLLFFASWLFSWTEIPDKWPHRVLITNDNGIDDIKIIELAKAFAEFAETYVIAPKADRSGSTNYLTAVRKGLIDVEKCNLGRNIHAYAVDGFPADCVLIGLAGIMKDNPPDVVVSGINGGPNLGANWMFSGTIGAARVASFAGFPAVAVSGLDDDNDDSVKAAVDWVVRFVQSSFIKSLEPNQYITVSLPQVPPDEIQGIRLARRAPELETLPVFEVSGKGSAEGSRETWKLTGALKNENPQPEDSDVVLYRKNYIVIVPMNIDEHDAGLLSRLKDGFEEIPVWKSKR